MKDDKKAPGAQQPAQARQAAANVDEDAVVHVYLRSALPIALGTFAVLLYIRGYLSWTLFADSIRAMLKAGYDETTLPRLHGVFAASFACALTVDLVGLLHTKTPMTRDLIRLLAFVNMLPFIVYTCLSFGIQPDLFPVPAGSPPVYTMRYIQWSFSTPTLVLMISRLSGPYRGPRSVLLVMVLDWIMIITGYLASISPLGSVQRYAWLAVSGIAWVFVLEGLWHFHTNAMSLAIHNDDINILRILRNVTTIVWTVFPVVWILEDLAVMHPFFVELSYALADFIAKMVYSMLLRAGTFMSVERLVVMEKDVHQAARKNPNKLAEQAEMGMRMVKHSINNADSGESMRAFLRAMSHELLTPLNAIAAAHESHLVMKSNTAQGVRWDHEQAKSVQQRRHLQQLRRNRHAIPGQQDTNQSSRIDEWLADQRDAMSSTSGTTIASSGPPSVVTDDDGSLPTDIDDQEMLAASVAVHTLRKTISNALHYSELSQGRKRLVRQDLDLYDALDACLDEVETTASRNRVAVLFSVARDVPRFIKSDLEAVKTVFVNLVDNAVKFSSDSVVTVRVELDSTRVTARQAADESDDSSSDADDDNNNNAGNTSATANPPKKRVTTQQPHRKSSKANRHSAHIRFVVLDHGPGMTPEQVEKAREPFTQLDSDLAGRTGGVGIGLTLVQEYTKLLRGQLSIDSEPGRGTVVDVTFPTSRSRRSSYITLHAPTWHREALSGIPIYIEGPFPSNPHIKTFIEDVCNRVGVRLVNDCSEAAGVLQSHFGKFAMHVAPDAVDKTTRGKRRRGDDGEQDSDRPIITMDLPMTSVDSDEASLPPVPLTTTRIRDALEYLATQFPSPKISRAEVKHHADDSANGTAARDTAGEHRERKGKGETGNTAPMSAPLARRHPGPTASTATSESSTTVSVLNQLRVLEVDDVAMNRRIVKTLLKKAGVGSILEADDGDVAVDMVQEHNGFDLICMDVSMPRMSGIDATKAIRALEGEGKVPRSRIIGITAHVDSDTSQGMLDAGMDGYRHKPVNAKMIGDVVKGTSSPLAAPPTPGRANGSGEVRQRKPISEQGQ